MQWMQKFYDIEDDKNPLNKKIILRNTKRSKDTNRLNKISINLIMCWKYKNKDAKNNVCIDKIDCIYL